jgi:hypothetical protein
MAGIDHTLIFRARNYIDGANVHRIKTWIFCYEISPVGSDARQRYERLLRDFVAARDLRLERTCESKRVGASLRNSLP